MSHLCRIVTCGQSLFMQAVEAGLAARPEIEVLPVDPNQVTTAAHIVAMEPDVVMVEQDGRGASLLLALLQQGIPLIRLGPDQGTITVLTGRQVQAVEVGDLVRVIEQIRGGDQEKEEQNA